MLPLPYVKFSAITYLQGDQNSPGVIPLAIKDVFSMIQDVSGFKVYCIFDALHVHIGSLFSDGTSWIPVMRKY